MPKVSYPVGIWIVGTAHFRSAYVLSSAELKSILVHPKRRDDFVFGINAAQTRAALRGCVGLYDTSLVPPVWWCVVLPWRTGFPTGLATLRVPPAAPRHTLTSIQFRTIQQVMSLNTNNQANPRPKNDMPGNESEDKKQDGAIARISSELFQIELH